MAAGGERGVLSRTMYENDFKKNSPVPFFVWGRLRRRPPRTPATQQHCPIPEKEGVLEEGEAPGN